MSSAAHRDSDLFVLSLLPSSQGGPPLPANDANSLPVMDLNSTDPLPALSDRPESNFATVSPLEKNAEKNVDSTASSQERSGLWLEGGVLMCSCPECRAPLSVRTWLMVADCWRCGTSIELTEEQEREVKR